MVDFYAARQGQEADPTEVAALLEGCKASVRAKVEHIFFSIKRMFGYQKVRYRVLGKNENRLALLFGFARILSGLVVIGSV